MTEFELSLTLWLQTTFGVDTWTVWNIITELGSAQVLLVIIGATLWLKSTEAGMRLLIGVLIAGVLVDILKVTIAHPRPYYAFVEIQAWRDSTGFGMPSGHAAAAMTLWGLLATLVRRWWFVLMAIPLIALIGISRIYFGVHTPLQVLMGWLLGFVIVIGVTQWGHRMVRLIGGMSLWTQLTLATSTTLVLVLLQLVVFQYQAERFDVPELWQQRYEEAINFVAARQGESGEPEPLALFTAFDISQTGVILGTCLLAIVVLRQGGFTAVDRRRRGASCVLGLLAIFPLIQLLKHSQQFPLAGFILWASIPLILGWLVPRLVSSVDHRVDHSVDQQ